VSPIGIGRARSCVNAFTLVLAFLLLSACATMGGRAAMAPRTLLRHTIDSLVAQDEFRNANFGILIVNPTTGDTLYSRNAVKVFMPASNQKLLTSSVALAQLGPDFRFRTTFTTRGTLRDSVLDGDLIIIGRGDPTLSDRMLGEAEIGMRRIADSLAAHGIRRITGRLMPGGNAFPDSIYGYGWELDDMYGSGTPVDELFFNEGMIDVHQQIAGRDTIVQIGTRNPNRSYLEALASALAWRGIAFAGITDSATDVSVAPTTLFETLSVPLRDILPHFLKPSQNQIGEILLKTIGLEKGGAGIADSGAAVVKRQLLAWGAEPDGFWVYDGSGLSRHDLVSPETLVRLLSNAQRETWYQIFYDALSVAGVDGTLRSRMKGTPAAGNMHAKTGTIEFVRSLSGYVTDADAHRLVFSILCNNFTIPVDSVTRMQDAIGLLLATYRARR
jgi:D-alanyl-D-alanine carboxypeptidase/D-alanyl-D-alanine-endopeptidase (penicillin-binding protein 4)